MIPCAFGYAFPPISTAPGTLCSGGRMVFAYECQGKTCASTVYVPPQIDAGYDQTLTIPSNQQTTAAVLLGQATGLLSAAQWTITSQPMNSNPRIETPTQLGTIVNNLIPGTYVFTLTMTDVRAVQVSDTVSVVVKSSTPVTLPPRVSISIF